jgi:hypothetical protein
MRRRLLVFANLVLLAGIAFAIKWREYAFDKVCAYVDTRVQAGRSTAREVGLRKINWVKGLENAFPLAKKTGRPVFVMVGDGSICTGRL